MRRRESVQVSLFEAVLVLSLAGAQGHQGATPADDGHLFEAAVRLLQDEQEADPLRVDPRPLRPDPALTRIQVTQTGGEAQLDVFWPGADTLIPTRRAILHRLGVPAMDGLPTYDCPPSTMPFRTLEEMERARRGCPKTAFRVALLAVPREGGAHSSSSQDARQKYAGRDVWSVRIIERSYSPIGRLEYSADLVFERGEGGWTFLERVNLLIIE